MNTNPSNISTKTSSWIHLLDPRVKILVLLAFSISLFFLNTWLGMGIMTGLCLIAMLMSKISFRQICAPLVGVMAICIMTILFNSFVLHSELESGVGNLVNTDFLVDGFCSQMPPSVLLDSLVFVPQGAERGVFYAVRIALLVLSSVIVALSTTSHEFSQALDYFLSPLRLLKVPTHQVSTTVTIAIRFIPLSMCEFNNIKSAQSARALDFNSGGLLFRLKAWTSVLLPLFVGMFRRAETLSIAMDSRCYGLDREPTSLQRLGNFSGAFPCCVGSMLALALVAVFL